MKQPNGLDALMLYLEAPNVHMHTLKIGIINTADFEGDFTFDLFRRTMRDRLPLLEPLRYRLIDMPMKMHHPVWQENFEVDLDYHLRRVQVPAPGGRRELERVIGEIASIPLDRAYPLWEIYFAEGMAESRLAVIAKVHHALADGVASANLFDLAVDQERPTGDAERLQASAPPSTGELLRAAGRGYVQQIRELPRLIKDTRGGVSRLRKQAKAEGGNAEPANTGKPPTTFLDHVLSPVRTFATMTLSLADIKETSKHLGVTINDLALAAWSGALRTLLLRYDGRVDGPLTISVPVNTDPNLGRATGNAAVTLLVPLPVHVEDPLERVRLTSTAAQIAKEKHQLLGPDLIGRWAAYLPAALAPRLFRRLAGREAKKPPFSVSISNVPGPRVRGRFAGASVSEFYSVGPIMPGNGFNITVWSYVDQFNVCVLGDGQTVDDPHEVTDALAAEFTLIRHVAGISGALHAVDTAMAESGK